MDPRSVTFDDFFELGQEEHASPFLRTSDRRWAKNLHLKASLFAALLLVCAFGLTWTPSYLPLSHLCLLGVYFFAGVPSLIESIEDLGNFEINIDVLMTLAAFSSVLIGSGLEGGLLLVLFALSHSIEDAVTDKAKGAISGLKKLAPSSAFVVAPDGSTHPKALADITVGTVILVKAGEVVPLDGVIIEGASSVNLVHLTGENFPIPKQVNDSVAAGARNLEGALTIRITRTSADSTLAKIVELVTQAQEARPRLQRWFDRVSKKYATSIIALSIAFTGILPLFGLPILGVDGSLYRALAFLIAASPCALILAIPIAYLSAVSVCAREGILLKGGITLDALASCQAIAFDKTGTLTTGQLTCLGVESLNPNKDHLIDEASAVAASMERNAVHPIAHAIVAYAQEKKLTLAPIEGFKSNPGYGLQALTKETKTQVLIGRLEFLKDKLSDHTLDKLKAHCSALKQRGELLAIMLLGEDLFIFRFSDTLRPMMRETIQQLQESGRWRLLILSGDHVTSVHNIAEMLDIREYHAELLPEQKLKYVSRLANDTGLAMVGDGVNDAPALARATVGICMGKVGSSTAVDASDVVLLHDDLTLLDWLMAKASKTQSIVKQNLIIAISAMAIASVSALLGFIPLWLAVIMHEGGTVLVGLNALRLLRGKTA